MPYIDQASANIDVGRQHDAASNIRTKSIDGIERSISEACKEVSELTSILSARADQLFGPEMRAEVEPNTSTYQLDSVTTNLDSLLHLLIRLRVQINRF